MSYEARNHARKVAFSDMGYKDYKSGRPCPRWPNHVFKAEYMEGWNKARKEEKVSAWQKLKNFVMRMTYR